mmetsp:Transcript_10773/g.18123  ORF Transcript_10773/g.18123 Transcript_10773/m.18123 type:complete len:537 (+) Transcript_10773:143-1753(+)
MTIKYKSTRGKQSNLSFEEVVLGGLASDRGLYVPETIPQFNQADIEKMRSMTFPDLAFQVISKFVQPEDIPADKLKSIIDKSFASFRCKDVTPVVKLKDYWVLELFHGPTFAFKDVALQFLGNVFEHFLLQGNIQNSITILGATSGDTGSAAIHGLRGKANVNCFIMFPTGKVTEIQERQMTTIADENVHCIGIEGCFDDAQAIVKAAFADEQFRKEVNLGAINSINLARVLAQITYYFYSYLRVTDEVAAAGTSVPTVSYAVPTGNFGDILAGYYAKRMGLPVGKLVVCTNENDVLHRFLQTGRYNKEPSVLTVAPSMDISVSSNFERYLFYLAGECANTLASWMSTFEKAGEVSVATDLLEEARSEFASFSADKPLIVHTMTETLQSSDYLVCPHTATAVAAIEQREAEANPLGLGSSIPVVLATAHPAKFEEAVNLAMAGCPEKSKPARPVELECLFSQSTRKVELANELGAVQNYIRGALAGTSINKSAPSTGSGSSDSSADDGFTNLLTWTAVAAAVATAGYLVSRLRHSM